MLTSPNPCFSRSVPEADEKFAAAAEAAGGRTEWFEHPRADPAGRPIGTRVAWLGPEDAQQVALYVSGTHGNEGWAGSAIQIDSLRRGAFADLPADRAVMMIHLINPWGCAWGCRENEENHDLFRDLIYYRPETRYDDSAYTQEMYEATTLRSYDDDEVERSNRQIGKLLDKIGLAELMTIMRRGQWRYPDGLFYNAGGLSWSFRLYRSLVGRYLEHAPRVLALDVHTGFGRYGEGMIYVENPDNDPKRRLLAEIYGEDAIFVGGSDPAIPAHDRFPYEIACDFVPGLSLVGTAVEFGAVELTDPVGVMRYVNYLFTRGDPRAPERPDLVEQYARFVCADDDDWREQVIERGREIVDQTLAGVAMLRDRRLLAPPGDSIGVAHREPDVTYSRESKAGTMNGGGTVSTVSVNGVQLRCEVQGNGAIPVVMVHGGFSSRSTWNLVAAELAETRRVILYDRRGHSESGPPTNGGTVRAHVSDLAGLIRQLDLAPAWVIGTSYGAQIALRLAAAEPDLLRGVVAHEPGLLLSLIADADGLAPVVDELSRKEDVIAKLIARGDHESAARELVETVLGPESWPLLPAELRRTYIQNAPAVLAELKDPERNDFDLASLAGFCRPVLLTKGAESPTFFGVVVEQFAAALPNAEVRTFPGAGHAPHMTHPDMYADAVGAYLRAHTK